jgi:hypothetical protein
MATPLLSAPSRVPVVAEVVAAITPTFLVIMDRLLMAQGAAGVSAVAFHRLAAPVQELAQVVAAIMIRATLAEAAEVAQVRLASLALTALALLAATAAMVRNIPSAERQHITAEVVAAASMGAQPEARAVKAAEEVVAIPERQLAPTAPRIRGAAAEEVVAMPLVQAAQAVPASLLFLTRL